MLQNKVQLIGNLGESLELKEVGENKVVNFSLATDESYKDKDGKKVEKTAWHRVVAWGKVAEILAEHTQKGSKIAVSGKLTYGKYTKEKDGVEFEIPTTEILVEEFTFLGSPNNKEE